ncbi:Tm-1-like ATP-binding domain-containing protein [Tropicimonas sp.]|uniref:Tm-1-like ATP-binding domain-containing protein n=1 Tax=Tropicimonas sp. TaxID=2067044 RepID=UPI003A8B55A5
MAGPVALLGTYETKPEELAALSAAFQEHGLAVVRVDLSLGAGGQVLPGDEKLRRMGEAVDRTVGEISAANPSAVVAVGGGTGSEMALRAMRQLPLDLPRFMITTLPFDPRGAVADSAITLVPTLCDVQGMNAILRRVFQRTAAMVAGVVGSDTPAPAPRRSVAVTMLGVTQGAGEEILRLLRTQGHETSAFHASGFGGAALTRFAQAGMFSGLIDMTVNEAVRLHVAGAHVPMPARFTCASALPRVLLPGAMNFLDGGALDQLRPEWRERPHYRQSSYFTHVKLTEPEMVRVATALAADLNTSTAPCEVLLPMGGFSSEDRPGGAIEDAALRECAAAVFEAEARSYSVTRIPSHISAPETAAEAVSRLLSHI